MTVDVLKESLPFAATVLCLSVLGLWAWEAGKGLIRRKKGK